MSYCNGCPFHQWVRVPLFYEDGTESVQTCIAGPEDRCWAEQAQQLDQYEMVKPCPTCKREIDGYDDCPWCLEVECLGRR